MDYIVVEQSKASSSDLPAFISALASACHSFCVTTSVLSLTADFSVVDVDLGVVVC